MVSRLASGGCLPVVWGGNRGGFFRHDACAFFFVFRRLIILFHAEPGPWSVGRSAGSIRGLVFFRWICPNYGSRHKAPPPPCALTTGNTAKKHPEPHLGLISVGLTPAEEKICRFLPGSACGVIRNGLNVFAVILSHFGRKSSFW